jgi:hypothetical protein
MTNFSEMLRKVENKYKSLYQEKRKEKHTSYIVCNNPESSRTGAVQLAPIFVA